MYNCLFDCKYCFLQGMYSSANYVIFVNYEDYYEEIKKISITNKKKNITIFSGYDERALFKVFALIILNNETFQSYDPNSRNDMPGPTECTTRTHFLNIA